MIKVELRFGYGKGLEYFIVEKRDYDDGIVVVLEKQYFVENNEAKKYKKELENELI